MKRIVICADGTWNRPEEDLAKDFPTNVLKVARAVAPIGGDGVPQVVFYDWGIGSYYGSASGGAFGTGINKNIQDAYRFLVQNYDPGDELYLFGDSSGKQWREWTKQANEQVGLELKWDVRPPGGSDHSQFIAASIPAIFFNTWLHPDYHTPDDTPDKINAQGGVKVLQLIAGLLEHAVTTDDRLVYVRPERSKPRPYLGVMTADHARGVLLESIAPRGPMQKAGGKAGDVLLSIGGKAVKSPGELRAFLGKSKTGDDVVAVVLRGEESVELKVRLDLRR